MISLNEVAADIPVVTFKPADPTVHALRDPFESHTILLEKVVETRGGKPKGFRYAYTYRSLSKSDAIPRASKALMRDLKGEDILHWRRVDV